MNDNRKLSEDIVLDKDLILAESAPVANPARRITAEVSEEAIRKGDAFAKEIEERFYADFERCEDMVKNGRAAVADRMAHVPTFVVVGDTVYVSYYANVNTPEEDPNNQIARLAYCPIDDPSQMTFVDVQGPGDTFDGQTINRVYDTILMQKDEDTLYMMWTARIDLNYYRFYCPFTLSTKTLGEIRVNRFKVGDIVNDYSATGIKSALAANDIPGRPMYWDTDIGIMQTLTSRVENGETYYYAGTYYGEFTCIVKSKDLETWEYVAQPDFTNDSQWENATYIWGDKCFYFVRQQTRSTGGYLTAYNFKDGTWDKPVIIDDCQSRSVFVSYQGGLYLFHAPIDREHIGVIKINTEDITKSEVVLQANMQGSCFYPYVTYFRNNELAMIYTINRKHIRLAEFTLSKYL